MMFSLM